VQRDCPFAKVLPALHSVTADRYGGQIGSPESGERVNNSREMTEEKKLNKEQLEAIQSGEGPLLIIAGAGTGKTTAITERIKWLVSSGEVKPFEILALTFTEKAAREMEERVDVVMPMGYTQMWISTFHAFGDRVLHQEALNTGLDPHFTLMTEAEAHLFVRKHLFEFELDYFRPHGNPTKFITGILQHFSRLKDEDVSPNEYLRWAQSLNKKTATQRALKKTESTEKIDSVSSRKLSDSVLREEVKRTLELARAYRKYEELKVKDSLMDFSDLISNTLKLFRARPSILKRYQNQFKYILVDEFQDTNIVQNELVVLLAGPRKNLTVVADDDQSIYKWRGAAVSNVLQFKQRFPEAKIVVLTKNYRSTQKILDHAYQLIQNNNPDRLEVKEGIEKKLVAVKNKGQERIKFFRLDRVENEAEAVASEIKKLAVDDKEYEFKDIAILVRANAHAESFTRALYRFGIPYQFLGPGMLLKQPEVKELIAYLKILYNLEDDVAMYSVLAMECFDVSPRDLALLVSFAKKYNFSLFEAVEEMAKEKLKVGSWIKISQDAAHKLAKIGEMIHRHLKLVPKETAGQILYYFLEDTGLLKKLTEYESIVEERKALNISKFFDKLKSYETEHTDASIYAVVDWLNLSLEMGESPLASEVDWSENNAVNILTAHSAKGLEFPVVFLVNLVPQRFPTRERKEQIPIPEELIKEILPEGDSHIQEERRLFYVGMTRAKDRLYFTAARYYGEGKLERRVSPFVYEALGVDVKGEEPGEVEQLGLLGWQKMVVPEERPLPARKVDYLSYSQLETFKRCPRQFQYRYILRIPVPPSAAASFGTSIHAALKDFYAQVVKARKPTCEDLLLFLERNWLSEGYSSKAHEERSFKEAKQMLVKFFQQAYSPFQKPIALEQVFTLRLDPNLKIGGRIDRVDDLGGEKIEIIDYKTGKVVSQKEVDRDLQMTVYAMAATNPGIYKKNPQEVILSFYFLKNQQKLSTKRTKAQLEKAKEQILQKAQEVRTSDFLPKPGNYCHFCEYQLLCEAWR
jgi:DNA helicase-2/ATP-dependent DNA helicase PcrA